MSQIQRHLPLDHPYLVTARLEGITNLIYPVYLPVVGELEWPLPTTVTELQTVPWRNNAGEICIPGSWVQSAIVRAAGLVRDPRNPSRNAANLYRAGIRSDILLASTGATVWDQLCDIQPRAQPLLVTKYRLVMNRGWVALFYFRILLPEYIGPQDLHAQLIEAGRLFGIGEHRSSTAGRFHVTLFEVAPATADAAAEAEE